MTNRIIRLVVTLRTSTKTLTGGEEEKPISFTFDEVFDENSTQAEIYEKSSRQIVESVLEGFNGRARGGIATF